MRNKSAFRIIPILCFLIALLLSVPYFKPYTGYYALFIAICAIIAIIGSKIKAMALRLVLSLVPFAIPVISFTSEGRSGLVSSVVLIILGLVFCIFMTAGAFEREYWRFRRFFIAMAGVSFFVTTINIIVYLVVEEPTKQAINIAGMVGFTICCALTGFFVLNQMRQTEADDRWKALNAGRIFSIFALAAALLMVVYLFLAFGFSRITPIIGRVAPRLEPDYATYEGRRLPYSQNTNTPTGSADVKDQLEDRELMVRAPKEEEKSLPWWYFAAGGVLILTPVVIILVRKKKRRAALGPDGAEGTASVQDDTDNAAAVRKAYRKYLAYIRKNGIELYKGSTSKDIMESSVENTIADAQTETELREIYIRARYGNPAEITDDDVKKFREIVSRIEAQEEKKD